MPTYKLQPVVAGPIASPLDGADKLGNSIKYVGPVQPVTTNFVQNDIWIDTVTAATPAIRVWSGTAFVPARGTGGPLFFEQFTGTNGAVWNTSNWTTVLTPTSGTGYGAVINGNQGQMTTSNTGGFAAASRIGRAANITGPTDANLSASFTFDTTSAGAGFMWVRGDASLNGTTGYSLTLTKGTYYMSKSVAGVGTDFNAGGTPYGYADGIQYTARLRVVGTTVQAKVWVATDSEPLAWGASVTDSAVTAAGKVGLTLGNGSAAVASNIYWDNVTIDPT